MMADGHPKMAEILTGRPDFADWYKAWTMRTSCSPSSPDGSGARSFRMQSEK
jgi:hypothetical protein